MNEAERIKEVIKEMLRQGEIKIETDIFESYSGKFVNTSVFVDGQRVATNTNMLTWGRIKYEVKEEEK